MAQYRGGPMRVHYRLESSMGGYVGTAATKGDAKKLAQKIADQHGYQVRVFKAKRNALRETPGTLVHTAHPRQQNPAGNVKFPSKWTNAQVRVNKQGKVQVKINPAKLERCVRDVKRRGGAANAYAVCQSALKRKRPRRKATNRRKARRR